MLKESGWSNARIAEEFKVSERTIIRKMEKDPVMSFANKVLKLLAEAPNDCCKKEILRSVNFIRTYRATNNESKKLRILSAIKSEAREVEEIAEDCRLTLLETQDLLDDLEAERKIYKTVRRKTFHYFLIVTL